jgi:metal-dependent amidase/aminoacylase/carboxypeptidase family protein
MFKAAVILAVATAVATATATATTATATATIATIATITMTIAASRSNAIADEAPLTATGRPSTSDPCASHSAATAAMAAMAAPATRWLVSMDWNANCEGQAADPPCVDNQSAVHWLQVVEGWCGYSPFNGSDAPTRAACDSPRPQRSNHKRVPSRSSLHRARPPGA